MAPIMAADGLVNRPNTLKNNPNHKKGKVIISGKIKCSKSINTRIIKAQVKGVLYG